MHQALPASHSRNGCGCSCPACCCTVRAPWHGVANLYSAAASPTSLPANLLCDALESAGPHVSRADENAVMDRAIQLAHLEEQSTAFTFDQLRDTACYPWQMCGLLHEDILTWQLQVPVSVWSDSFPANLRQSRQRLRRQDNPFAVKRCRCRLCLCCFSGLHRSLGIHGVTCRPPHVHQQSCHQSPARYRRCRWACPCRRSPSHGAARKPPSAYHV